MNEYGKRVAKKMDNFMDEPNSVDREINDIQNAIEGYEVRGALAAGVKKSFDKSKTAQIKSEEATEITQNLLNDSFDTSKINANFEQRLDTEIRNLQPDWTKFKEDTTSQLAQLATIVASPTDTDQTLTLQNIFDNISDGTTVRIPKGIYTVSKNKSLSGFPNSDQPCVLIRNKKNIKIIADGAVIKTNTHAQGVLELQLCKNVVIEGLKVEGPGSFPNLDGTTGRGEKGTASAGYYTSGFWGYHKNNSYDTSNKTEGGNIPKPWSKYNGGFIGNVAYGVLVHNECDNITFRGCEATGFNYAGFGVGHYGDYFPNDLNYKVCKDVIFDRCYSHRNYSANYFITDVDGFQIVNQCISENAGHPEAKPLENDFADPGYGVTITGIEKTVPKNGLISGSIFRDCIRKGVDLHAGNIVTVENNTIKNCYMGGIYGAWTSPIQPTKNLKVKGNTIEDCGVLGMGGFYYQGCIGPNYSKDNIKANIELFGNFFKNCGSSAIVNIRSFDGASIKFNTVEGVDERHFNDNVRAFLLGKTGERSFNLAVGDNNVIDSKTGKIVQGIRVLNVEDGEINSNNIDISSSNVVEPIGLYSTDNGTVDFCDNYAILGEKGIRYSLAQTKGTVRNNKGLGGNAKDFNDGIGRCLLTLLNKQTINTGSSFQRVEFSGEIYNEGLAFSVGNGKLLANRKVVVVLRAQIGWDMGDEDYAISLTCRKNGENVYGSPFTYRTNISKGNGVSTISWISMPIELNEGDFLEVYANQNSSVTRYLQTSNRSTWLSAEELR